MKPRNIFAALPRSLADEQFEELLGTDTFLLERIISLGHATAKGEWYDQQRDEWVVLLSGSAGLRIEGVEEVVVMGPGDYLLLPAHCRHRVEWTESSQPTVWLALHFRGDSRKEADHAPGLSGPG